MFELNCRDVGVDCGGVVVGATREDFVQEAAVDASTVHRTGITPERAVQVASLIREQGAPAAPK